ncbi:MAG: hypothetical protein NC822_04710 [Candidatus Omnitrophica bacterium]|nr:hypothetical protein [Candidatus Omnitrophota bacterium]MCM8826685.1 hypothetical protein [Candidatus Omnitrophota bacterium]
MGIFSLVVARKGSKGLANKVVQLINGKYVFEYSIEYSLNLAKLINVPIFTVVSSDSELIETYCLSKGIYFIKREDRLSSDTCRIEEVIYDAYTKVGKNFKYISLLYGNVPTRYPDEFLKAYNFLEGNNDYDAVLSMQNVEKYNPSWMFEYNEEILPLKEKEGYRRQDLKQFMIHDGHTILFRSDYFINFIKNGKKDEFMYQTFGKKIKPLINNKLIVDVDTKSDLILADSVLKVMGEFITDNNG